MAKSTPKLPASSRMQMPGGSSAPMTAPKKGPLKNAAKGGKTLMSKRAH